MNSSQTAKVPIIREGLTAFILSAFSAAASLTAIMTWNYMAENITNLDSGGPAFATNIEPMVITLLGIVIGGLALLMTCLSLSFREERFLKSFTFFHVFALLLITPATCLLVKFMK